MDILGEIKRWTSKTSQPPWPLGYDPNTASDAAKFAAKMLADEELVAISRFNKFRYYRNRVLIEVRKKYSLPVCVLPELTGMCGSTCRLIVGEGKRKNG